MLVTRFCSLKEFDAFKRGDDLVNNTDHYKDGRGGSTSIGFCFSRHRPEVCFEYLKGIVDTEICMILDFPDEYLSESIGKYRDINKLGKDGRYQPTLISELCCTTYNNRVARLIAYTDEYHKLCPNASDLRTMFNNTKCQ